MRIRFLLLKIAAACALATPGGASQAWTPATYEIEAPPPPGFDRAQVQRDTRAHLERMVVLDTQNPPGNEKLVADYLAGVLASLPHVQTHVFEVAEGRANFVARLSVSNPTRKAVMILAHMDVVGADPAKWESPAFETTEKEGYLYGRGVIDDKGMLSAALVAFLQLATERERLDRDIILLATAAEEGGPDIGVHDLVQNHFELIHDAEFALNEGGRIRVRDGRIVSVNIQTTEKVAYNVSASATGPSGHGSIPLPDNVLAALARAVTRVHEWKAPVRLNETTRTYFARLSREEPDAAMAAAMRAISAPGANAAAIDKAAGVLSANPLHNAILRSGQSLTLFHGGIRTNVIPSQASAVFNFRVLPGDDVLALVEEMERVAAEPAVRFELLSDPLESPPPSPMDTALFRTMERVAKEIAPRAGVIPFMSTGATDGAVLRAAGIPTYGILPMPMPEEDELRMHGDNERVPIPALGWAAEYLYRVLAGVARKE